MESGRKRGRKPRIQQFTGDVTMSNTNEPLVKHIVLFLSKTNTTIPSASVHSIADADAILTEWYNKGYELTGHPQNVSEAPEGYGVLYVLHKK